MRADGRPSPSTVASVMALTLSGAARSASANHARNSASGSSGHAAGSSSAPVYCSP
jgi:hypothetical protein